jgi:tetratricopeptide (TPR) repeat protein
MYLLDRQPSRTEEDEKSPLEYLDTAVRLDPNYAKAWAAKAFAHYAAMPVPVRDSEHYRKAHEALDKALSLDPNEPLAHAALCHQRLFDDWNYSGAEEAGLRAIELDPGSSFAHSEYAVVLTSRERFAEAFDHLRKAMETDPTSFRILAYYANTLFMARRYREAEEQYRNLIDLKPDREATYSWLIRIAEVQGKEAEAFEWTVKDMIALGKGEEAVQRYKTAYETSGYRGAVLERINQKIMPVHGYVYLGDKDNAFAAMEENYKKRNYYLGVFGMVDPTYDSLRSDPRWADMVRRIKNN